MADNFAAQLKRFAEKTDQELRDVDVAFKFGVFNDAVKLTPVVTGRLKGNWQISNGGPAQGVVETFGAEGVGLDPAAAAEIQPFAATYLTNNIEYGPYVEANQGFVGRAIANARIRLEQAVRDD